MQAGAGGGLFFRSDHVVDYNITNDSPSHELGRFRKPSQKNGPPYKGAPNYMQGPKGRAAQRTTLAPRRSKYRTCDKKYRGQKH